MLTRRDALRSLLLTGAAAAAGPTLAGCGSERSGPAGTGTAAAAVARSGLTRAPGDAAAQRAVVASVQAFTADVYQRLAVEPGNLACSPYSIAVALAMTRNGARGRTAAEMDRVLHAPTLAGLNSGLNALTRHVESRAGSKKLADGSSTEVAVGVANSLWGQHGMPWEPAFLDALARDYGAGLQLVDYARRDEAAARINAWVAERTRKRIRDLVPPEVLDAMTRLVLVNAIYLKAAWKHSFERELTSARPFTRADGSVVRVPTMSSNGMSAERAVGAGWQAVRLRCAGDELAMAVVLPDRGRLAEVERALDGAALGRLLDSFAPASVDLQLPRWTMRTKVPLKETLTAMGMPTAFEERSADFSGMTARERLYISAVLHQAFVAVDEHGMEAAAATAVIMRAFSGPPPGVPVVVDRTFLYVIHDVATATPLFVGRVDDPSAVDA